LSEKVLESELAEEAEEREKSEEEI